MSKEEILKRLQDKTRIVGTCFVFGKFGPKTYGQLFIDGKSYLIHRLSAWIYLNLDLNDSKIQAQHKDDICNRKDCWNPEHLKIGDAFQNIQEWRNSSKFKSNRGQITYCKRGHKTLVGAKCKECHNIAVRKNRALCATTHQ